MSTTKKALQKSKYCLSIKVTKIGTRPKFFVLNILPFQDICTFISISASDILVTIFFNITIYRLPFFSH